MTTTQLILVGVGVGVFGLVVLATIFRAGQLSIAQDTLANWDSEERRRMFIQQERREARNER